MQNATKWKIILVRQSLSETNYRRNTILMWFSDSANRR